MTRPAARSRTRRNQRAQGVPCPTCHADVAERCHDTPAPHSARIERAAAYDADMRDPAGPFLEGGRLSSRAPRAKREPSGAVTRLRIVRDQVQSVDCPRCKALPGTPCSGIRSARTAPHAERYAAFRAAQPASSTP